MEKLCVQSFIDHGHEFHLYTYGNIGGIPPGAIIKDASEILPESEIFQYRNGSLAGFSDYFRWALLSRQGNFWVDMDVVCIKPFAFDSDICFAGFGGTRYGVSVLAFPKQHIFTQTMEDACRNHTEERPWDTQNDRKRKLKGRWLRRGKERARFGRIGGPDWFTRVVQHFGLEHHAKPFMYFYPIDSMCWRNAFDRSFAESIGLFENTYAIHLTNELMRRTTGFDKNACFDEQSLFEQLKKKHGIEQIQNAPRINSATMMRLTSKDNTEKRKRKRIALAVIAVVFIIGFIIGKSL